MPLDRTDPVWDEYLSTGEDPTGGALEEKARAATYDDGYRDGYECGYDDGDCNEGYGYSWISADMDQFYSIAYKKGFRIGYREGFSVGMEDYQYSNGI